MRGGFDFEQLHHDEASEVVRVSFGEETTESDIDALVEGIKEYKEMFIA